jgi:Uma2 family endonuclease
MNAPARKAIPISLSEREYLAFLDARPEEERWQLFDGDPLLMTPPTGTHQRIAANLARLLDTALELSRPAFATLQEIGVRIPGYASFLPVPDLVVADALAPTGSFLDKFYLAAEVMSDSNTAEFIRMKVGRYAEHPDNLHILVISQTEMSCEAWSRASGWTQVVLQGPEAVLDLPEFGFRQPLRLLYRNSAVALL